MNPPNWFVALPAPPAPGIEHASATLPEGLRRIAAEDRHVTVAFLGACGEERARAAWEALAPMRHPPVEATFAGWRAMGPPRRPSAWALVFALGGEALAELAEQWGGAALSAAGLPAPARPPLPHLTLARPSRKGAASSLRAMERWLATAPVPAFPVRFESISLYTRNPEPGAARFSVVAARSLDAGP